jgi:hypothetical protein
MATFPVILTLLLEPLDFLGLTSCKISPTLIFQETSANFGGAGTFHFLHGLEITYIYRWVVVEEVHG